MAMVQDIKSHTSATLSNAWTVTTGLLVSVAAKGVLTRGPSKRRYAQSMMSPDMIRSERLHTGEANVR